MTDPLRKIREFRVELRKFLADRLANVALTTAICAVPLFGLIGIAIDYAVALSAKSKLDAAADAAAVAAITTAQSVMQGGASFAVAQPQGVAQGIKVFAANAGSIPFGSAPTPTVTISNPTSLTLTATVNYQSSTKSNFGALFGKTSFSVQGSSSSSLGLTTYINYYILIDVSQSMGIGATATDMQNLFDRVVAYNNGFGTGCVFGCHVAENGQTYTNENLAHSISPPITLRIDAARTAVQNIITQAQASSTPANNIKIGIYTMSEDPTPGATVLKQISAPTYDFGTLWGLAAFTTTSTPAIDLGNNQPGGIGDSDFPDSLSLFNSSFLPANGTGLSASSPLNYVFIITDGVQDVPGGSCPSGHCVQAISSSLCAPLQQKATVGVIYTTYLPIYNNNDSSQGYQINYQQLVLPIASQIAPNLQACASSPSLYYEASDGPALILYLQKLFASTSQLARLSQ